MTLHERILVFYAKDSFRFKLFHKKKMGSRLRNIWDNVIKGSKLPVVDSIEEYGTFKVADYPEQFVPIIDQMIRVFKSELLEERKTKKPDTKKKPQCAPPAVTDGKPRRKRIQKPIYSTRNQ